MNRYQSPTGVTDPREMKLWVPYPRRVLVFAARVGSRTLCGHSLFC